jgi:hypothetical protein
MDIKIKTGDKLILIEERYLEVELPTTEWIEEKIIKLFSCNDIFVITYVDHIYKYDRDYIENILIKSNDEHDEHIYVIKPQDLLSFRKCSTKIERQIKLEALRIYQ